MLSLESPDLHFMGNMVLLKRRVVLPYAQLEVNLHASNIHRQAEQAGKQWTPPNLPSSYIEGLSLAKKYFRGGLVK